MHVRSRSVLPRAKSPGRLKLLSAEFAEKIIKKHLKRHRSGFLCARCELHAEKAFDNDAADFSHFVSHPRRWEGFAQNKFS
jgi:hypothetical protein